MIWVLRHISKKGYIAPKCIARVLPLQPTNIMCVHVMTFHNLSLFQLLMFHTCKVADNIGFPLKLIPVTLLACAPQMKRRISKIYMTVISFDLTFGQRCLSKFADADQIAPKGAFWSGPALFTSTSAFTLIATQTNHLFRTLGKGCGLNWWTGPNI